MGLRGTKIGWSTVIELLHRPMALPARRSGRRTSIPMMKNRTRPWRGRTLAQGAALGLLVLGLAACVRVREAPPPEAPLALASECVPPTERSDGKLLSIDRGASELRILSYRAGRLAHLGHNHVIASRDLWGYAVLAKTLTGSRFALCVPVKTLIVDDPQLRAAAGAEFASEVPETTSAGTRRNMLRESQLDGTRHPFIVVLGHIVGGTPPQVAMALELRVREAVHSAPITVRFERSAGGVLVSGELEVRQTDLGIQPYSALFGALVVRDEIAIQFQARATSKVR